MLLNHALEPADGVRRVARCCTVHKRVTLVMHVLLLLQANSCLLMPLLRLACCMLCSSQFPAVKGITQRSHS
jgi:hypothetical protein